MPYCRSTRVFRTCSEQLLSERVPERVRTASICRSWKLRRTPVLHLCAVTRAYVNPLGSTALKMERADSARFVPTSSLFFAQREDLVKCDQCTVAGIRLSPRPRGKLIWGDRWGWQRRRRSGCACAYCSWPPARLNRSEGQGYGLIARPRCALAMRSPPCPAMPQARAAWPGCLGSTATRLRRRPTSWRGRGSRWIWRCRRTRWRAAKFRTEK